MYSIFSRRPARITIAIVNPTAVANPDCVSISYVVEGNTENRAVGCNKRKVYTKCLIQRNYVFLEDHLNKLNEHRNNKDEYDGLKV